MAKKIAALISLFLFLALLALQPGAKPALIFPASAPLRLLSEFGAVVLLLFAGFGMGALWSRAVFRKAPVGGMESLVALGFGFTTLSLFGFGLAAVRLLERWMIFVPLSIAFLYGWVILFKAKAGAAKVKLLTPGDYPLVLGLAALMVLCLIRALTPPQSWDEQVYHLLAPKLYLGHGGFLRVPGNIYASFPENQEMIFALALGISDAIAAQLFNFSCAVLVLMTLALMGREFFGSTRAGLLAAVLFGFCVTFYFEATSGYIDLALVFPSLLSLYGLFRFRDEQNYRWLLASAFLAGGALGIKYTAAGVLLANAILVLFWSRKRRWLNAPVYLAVAGIFLLPWLAKNFALVNNPFFPFLVKYLGGPEWNQVLLSRWISSLRFEGMGRTPWDYIALFPRIFLYGRLESLFFDARWNILLLFLSPLSFIFVKDRRYLWLWLWFLIVFAVWAAGAQHGRFLMSGIACLALLSGGALGRITKLSGKFFGAFIALIFLLFSIPLLPLKKMEVRDDLSFITGKTSWPQYLLAHEDRESLKRIDRLLALNRQTPRGAKIFMLWENRGLYLDRPYLADSGFEASYTKQVIVECGTPEIFEKWLKQNGFDYVYNGWTGPWDRPSYLPEESLAEFREAEKIYRQFVAEYGEVVSSSGAELVRVK